MNTRNRSTLEIAHLIVDQTGISHTPSAYSRTLMAMGVTFLDDLTPIRLGYRIVESLENIPAQFHTEELVVELTAFALREAGVLSLVTVEDRLENLG